MTKKPFIYIASLRRTGSTVLSEALSQVPYSYILREPALCRNKFAFRDADVAVFAELGIDLQAFKQRHRKWVRFLKPFYRRTGVVLPAFCRSVYPEMCAKVQQIGIKEIRHEKWRRYLRAFPDMKIIITARDPRDIYISLYYRLQEQRRGWRWKGEYEPVSFAEHIRKQFRMQQNMMKQAPYFKTRYEDFCTNPAIIDDVKAFVESPIPGLGEIGGYLSADERREGEHKMHGGEITTKRVRRFEREENAELVEQANRVFDLLPEYCDYWEYRK